MLEMTNYFTFKAQILSFGFAILSQPKVPNRLTLRKKGVTVELTYFHSDLFSEVIHFEVTYSRTLRLRVESFLSSLIIASL